MTPVELELEALRVETERLRALAGDAVRVRREASREGSQVGTLRRTARRNAAKRGSYRAWAVGDQCFEAVFGKGYRDVPRSTLTHCWLVIPVVRTISGGEGNRELVEQLNLDKRQLGQLLLQPAQKLSAETNQRIETLEGEVEKIESQLAQHVAGLGQVRHALGVSSRAGAVDHSE